MSVLAPESFSGIMSGAWDFKSAPFQTRELARLNNQATLDQARINADALLNQVKAQGANELDRMTLLNKLNRRAEARAGLFTLGTSLAGAGSGGSGRYAGSSEIRDQLLRLAAPRTMSGQVEDYNTLVQGLNTTRNLQTPWSGYGNSFFGSILNGGSTP